MQSEHPLGNLTAIATRRSPGAVSRAHPITAAAVMPRSIAADAAS
jgi:hypothetical protein